MHAHWTTEDWNIISWKYFRIYLLLELLKLITITSSNMILDYMSHFQALPFPSLHNTYSTQTVVFMALHSAWNRAWDNERKWHCSNRIPDHKELFPLNSSDEKNLEKHDAGHDHRMNHGNFEPSQGHLQPRDSTTGRGFVLVFSYPAKLACWFPHHQKSFTKFNKLYPFKYLILELPPHHSTNISQILKLQRTIYQNICRLVFLHRMTIPIQG